MTPEDGPDADTPAAAPPPRDRRLSAEERDDLAAARLLALTWMPYLATALFEITAVARRGLGTFAVDAAWRLYVDPVAQARWGPERTAGVLLHEVSHLLRCHHARHHEHPRTHALAWNLAADAEINDDLLAGKIPLPDGAVTPHLLGLPDGQLAERYFTELLPDPAEASELDDPACGSGAGGIALPDELPDDDEPAGRSELDADLIRRSVAETIRDATSADPGQVPGGWRRWAEATLSPAEIPWQQRLRRTVRRAFAVHAGQLSTSYRRPGRRRIPRVLTPAMVAPALTVGVIVDTSASMSDQQTHRALSELDAICRRAGISPDNLIAVSADITVHALPRLRNATDLPLLGGGGTDLRPAIAHLARHRRRPQIIIVLTDGFTPWPELPPPRSTVIAVLIPRADGQTAPPPPPWAETIELSGHTSTDPPATRARR